MVDTIAVNQSLKWTGWAARHATEAKRLATNALVGVNRYVCFFGAGDFLLHKIDDWTNVESQLMTVKGGEVGKWS